MQQYRFINLLWWLLLQTVHTENSISKQFQSFTMRPWISFYFSIRKMIVVTFSITVPFCTFQHWKMKPAHSEDTYSKPRTTSSTIASTYVNVPSQMAWNLYHVDPSVLLPLSAVDSERRLHMRTKSWTEVNARAEDQSVCRDQEKVLLWIFSFEK